MIATADKFAGMPWTGEIAAFSGAVERFDAARRSLVVAGRCLVRCCLHTWSFRTNCT